MHLSVLHAHVLFACVCSSFFHTPFAANLEDGCDDDSEDEASDFAVCFVASVCFVLEAGKRGAHLQCCVWCVCMCVCCKSFPHLCSVCVAPTLCPPPFIPRRISRPPLVSSERGRYFSPGSKRSPRSEPLLLFCISACGVCVCVVFLAFFRMLVSICTFTLALR